jgi:ribosomal protein L37AE/L43A
MENVRDWTIIRVMARLALKRGRDRRECPSCRVQGHNRKLTSCPNCGQAYAAPVAGAAEMQPLAARRAGLQMAQQRID